MVVAAVRLTIEIPGSASLKDKRRVVVSLCERIRHTFHVSVAEVDAQDVWNRVEIGIAIVSGSASIARQSADAVVRFVDAGRAHEDAVLLDTSTELLTGL